MQRWNLKVGIAYNFYIILFIVLFQDFVIGLSILVRGTMEEKVRWMFTLYDQDRDGYISRFDYIFFLLFLVSPWLRRTTILQFFHIYVDISRILRVPVHIIWRLLKKCHCLQFLLLNIKLHSSLTSIQPSKRRKNSI